MRPWCRRMGELTLNRLFVRGQITGFVAKSHYWESCDFPQQVVPAAVRAHFHNVDRHRADLADDAIDLLRTARGPRPATQVFAVNPFHFAHISSADGARTRGIDTVVLGSGTQQKVGVTDLLKRQTPCRIIFEYCAPAPLVRYFSAIDEHAFHRTRREKCYDLHIIGFPYIN